MWTFRRDSWKIVVYRKWCASFYGERVPSGGGELDRGHIAQKARSCGDVKYREDISAGTNDYFINWYLIASVVIVASQMVT